MIHVVGSRLLKLLAFRQQIHPFVHGSEMNVNVPVHAQFGRHESVLRSQSLVPGSLPIYVNAAQCSCSTLSLVEIQPESFLMLNRMCERDMCGVGRTHVWFYKILKANL